MGWVQRLGFLFTRPRSAIPPGMERTLERVRAIVESAG
jgi:Ethanolamine utilization protein EutJ (predicted chaperonin)